MQARLCFPGSPETCSFVTVITATEISTTEPTEPPSSPASTPSQSNPILTLVTTRSDHCVHWPKVVFDRLPCSQEGHLSVTFQQKQPCSHHLPWSQPTKARIWQFLKMATHFFASLVTDPLFVLINLAADFRGHFGSVFTSVFVPVFQFFLTPSHHNFLPFDVVTMRPQAPLQR